MLDFTPTRVIEVLKLFRRRLKRIMALRGREPLIRTPKNTVRLKELLNGKAPIIQYMYTAHHIIVSIIVRGGIPTQIVIPYTLVVKCMRS